MHFEKLINGVWEAVNPEIKQIYPIDVPHK